MLPLLLRKEQSKRYPCFTDLSRRRWTNKLFWRRFISYEADTFAAFFPSRERFRSFRLRPSARDLQAIALCQRLSLLVSTGDFSVGKLVVLSSMYACLCCKVLN